MHDIYYIMQDMQYIMHNIVLSLLNNVIRAIIARPYVPV